MRTDALPLSSTSIRYSSSNDTIQSAWDFNFGHTCLCDSDWLVGLLSGQTQLAEYFGPYCDERRCPSGDDPTTTVDETDCEGKIQTGGSEVGEAGNLCQVDCSNKGVCDHNTGVCKCFHGFGTENCGTRNTY
jgi:hypothetical protein